MSVFSFPRIHVKGLIAINVGTANNDDYSSIRFPPGSPYAGQPVRLADSVQVQPLTYGMSDAAWVAWAQAPQKFTTAAPARAAASAPPARLDLQAGVRASMTRAESVPDPNQVTRIP